MFYFNAKSKAAQSAGESYNAPFGLYTIISGSMEPNVKIYDVVVSANVNDLSTVKVGDIITFISSWDLNYGVTVTHRVVSITRTEDGEYQFVTKGDNNTTADGAVVTQSNLIGKVVLRFPQLGRLQFFLATQMGWFVVVLIPALGIIIYDLIKIFKLMVLKKNLNVVTDAKEAETIVFEGDNLDNMDLTEERLSRTSTFEITPVLPEVKMPEPKIENTIEIPVLISEQQKVEQEQPKEEATSTMPALKTNKEVIDSTTLLGIIKPEKEVKEETIELPIMIDNNDIKEAIPVKSENTVKKEIPKELLANKKIITKKRKL